MPPVDQSKADPLTLLLDEIEMLSAQTRSLELSLKRAHTDAFDEAERFQQEFRVKVTNLKAEFDNKRTQHGGRGLLDSPPNSENEDLLRRCTEQQNLIQRGHEESERRGAAIVALREQLAHLQATNRELEQDAALRTLEQGQNLQNAEQELRNRNRELQGRLAAKESVIESQEFHLRNAQAELLKARDALDEKERALAQALARITEQDERFCAELNQWQCRSADSELLIERHLGEIQSTKAELAAAAERERNLLQEKSANQGRAQSLSDQVGELQTQLNDKQVMLDRQDEILRGNGAREAELSAALGKAQDALAGQEANARRIEQDLTAEIAELRLAHERNAAVLHADGVANQVAPEFKAQIDNLQTEVQEKERLLEARAREIDILQARVESLSGQAARLEAEQKQALADALDETYQSRQALQAEIAALQSTAAQRQAVLEEEQTAHNATKQTLGAELEGLQDRYSAQQTSLKKQGAEMRQAVAEVDALRDRLAQSQSAARDRDEIARGRSDSVVVRIAELEGQLQRAKVMLAEREAALARAAERLQNPNAAFDATRGQVSGTDQSAQFRAAQDKNTELLDRLAQLEADRHALQENAGHELQQLRESFETRIARLRMELASKEHARAQDSSPEKNQIAATGLEQGFQQQIRELQTQLAEQHTLLAKRNQEIGTVKAELDALHDHFAPLSSSSAGAAIDKSPSVELREEDAVDSPPQVVTGPDTLDTSGMSATEVVRQHPADVSNRFTQLEARVRLWNPQPEKESAFGGGGRRWNIGLFKRRWKA